MCRWMGGWINGWLEGWMDRDQKCSSSFFIFKHVNEQDVLIPYRIAKVDNLKLTIGRRVRLNYPLSNTP